MPDGRRQHLFTGRLPQKRDDAGFGLIELIVATIVFALLATGVISMLNLAIDLARNDRNRVAAAQLAARELEIVRNQFFTPSLGPKTIPDNLTINPNPLPGGIAAQPLVVDGVPYTVSRTAQWSTGGGGGSTCDAGGTGELNSLRVHVDVSWPRMDGVRPVVSDTLLTPPKGIYSSYSGHIAVNVVDRNGKPQAAMPVALSGPTADSGLTDADGCAVFAFLTPGAYTVSLNQSGYVNGQSEQSVTSSVSVTSGSISQVPLQYDQAASLSVSFDLPAGYALPATNNMAVSLANTGLASGLISRPGSGNPRVVPGLWPFPDGYTAWAGDCNDADPRLYGGSRQGPFATNPGAQTTATLQLAETDITVKTSSGSEPASTPVASAQVVAVHEADALGCPSVESLTLGNTDASGLLRVLLPFGYWTFRVLSRSAAPIWPSATLSQSSSTTPIVVVVQ